MKARNISVTFHVDVYDSRPWFQVPKSIAKLLGLRSGQGVVAGWAAHRTACVGTTIHPTWNWKFHGPDISLPNVRPPYNPIIFRIADNLDIITEPSL